MCHIFSPTWVRNFDARLLTLPVCRFGMLWRESRVGSQDLRKATSSPIAGIFCSTWRVSRAPAPPPGKAQPRASRNTFSRANGVDDRLQIDQSPSRTIQETTAEQSFAPGRSLVHEYLHPVLGCTKCTQCTQCVHAHVRTHPTTHTQPPSAPHPARSSPPMWASNPCLTGLLSTMVGEIGVVAGGGRGVSHFFTNLGT